MIQIGQVYGPAQGNQIVLPYNGSIPWSASTLIVQNYTNAVIRVGPNPGSGYVVTRYTRVSLPWKGERTLAIGQIGTDAIQATDLLEVDANASPLVGSDYFQVSPIIPDTFTRPISLGPNGGIYQGTGTFASPTTGMKIYEDSNGNGRLEFWYQGVLYYELDPTAIVGYVEAAGPNGSFLISVDKSPNGPLLGQISISIDATGTISILSLHASSPNQTTGPTFSLKVADNGDAEIIALGHLLTAGAAPTVTAGAQAGAGATATLAAGSTDSAGVIHVTTGTGAGGGQIAVLTFATPYASAPFCLPGWGGNLGGEIGYTATTTQVSIVAGAPASSSSYDIAYLVVGH